MALTVDCSAGCRGIVRLSGLACPLVRDHRADLASRQGRGYGRPRTRASARPGYCPGATGPSGCHPEGRAGWRTPAWSLNRRTAQGAERHECVTYPSANRGGARRPDSYPVRADHGVRRGHGRALCPGRLPGPQPQQRRGLYSVHRRFRLPDRHAVRGAQVRAADGRAAGRLRPADRAGIVDDARVLRQRRPACAVGSRRRHRAVHCRVRGRRVRHPARPVRESRGSASGRCWPSSRSASC